MKHWILRFCAAVGLSLLVLVPTWSKTQEFSGFLDDYSQLKPFDDHFDLVYIAPGAFERLREYDAILMEQPEIFIASQSKYSGMKPDDMKVLADSFLEILAHDMEPVFSVTDKPGPRVLHMRVALSGLYLKKKHSKNPLAYTPVGFALHGVKKALTKDLTKKISLVEVTIEAEILDSRTQERLAAVVVRRGTHKDKEIGQKRDPSSWEEVEAVMSDLGGRLACRLSNSKKPRESWVDCRSAATEGKADMSSKKKGQ